MEALHRQIANLCAAKKTENGQVFLPRKHGDDGLYGYTPHQHPDMQRDVCLFTFDRRSLEGLDDDPWMRFLPGEKRGYPLEALHDAIESVRSRVAGLRVDPSIDYERA